MFEITYSDIFEDHEIKKIVFSNCIHLISSLKGNNIIINSGTDDYFLHRSPFDISSMYFLLILCNSYFNFNKSGVVLGLKPDIA